jgi:hypothetical protein
VAQASAGGFWMQPGSLHHKKLAQLFLQYTKESSSTSTTQLKAVVIAPEL